MISSMCCTPTMLSILAMMWAWAGISSRVWRTASAEDGERERVVADAETAADRQGREVLLGQRQERHRGIDHRTLVGAERTAPLDLGPRPSVADLGDPQHHAVEVDRDP